MVLAITEPRYLEIRRRVRERTAEVERQRLLVDSVHKPAAKTFQTVDECMSFLDALADQEIRPPRSRRKRQ
jgi:hypothetical protein